jgi:hypothetical protein
MKTLIAIEISEESFKCISCQEDGGPEILGRMLANHYAERKNVILLMKEGNLQRLGATPIESLKFIGGAQSFDSEEQFQKFARDNSIQYEYVFRNSRWYFRSDADQDLCRYTYIPPQIK